MMREPVLPLIVLCTALVTSPATGSTPNTGPKPWDASFSGGASPTAVVNHLKCVITELRDDRVVKVWDEASRSEHLVRIAEEVGIKARRKADFGGRSKLGFEDFRIGHRIKLTYRTGDGTIVGVRVIDRVKELPAPSDG